MVRTSLIESNQQICDIYKTVIFEKQRYCGTLQCNTESCCEHVTGDVDIQCAVYL